MFIWGLYLLSVFLLQLSEKATAGISSNTECETIYLLHVVPRSNVAVDAGKVYASELTSMADFAAEDINADPRILPGYRLQIINVVLGDCSQIASVNIFLHIYSKLAQSELKCVFGIVGLYCSYVTKYISSQLGHPKFGYIQLSSSTSPLLSKTAIHPYLFRFMTSSETYADAVRELTTSFNWTKLSISYDSVSSLHRTTSINLATKVSMEGLQTFSVVPIGINCRQYATGVYNSIILQESRIAVFSVTSEQGSAIMCEGFHRGLIWPIIVHIFVEQSSLKFLSDGSCSNDELLQAIEGIFILRRRLFVNDNVTLVSGRSYHNYSKAYIEKVKATNGTENMLANTLHDQVWAFSLAFNRSIDKINTDINDSFHQILSMTPSIRDMLMQGLKLISFQGATTKIDFNENQETETPVDIFQVRNGKQILIATYSPRVAAISFKDTLDMTTIPSDSFNIIHFMFPLWLEVATAILQLFLIATTLFIIAGHIYWKQRAEIKSSGFKISIIMLVGCLLICLTSIFRSISVNLNLPIKTAIVVCNTEIWLFYLGVTVIAAALLFRLLRIYCFFNSSHPINKHWSDYHVIFYIIITCSIILLLLLVWMIVDHLKPFSRLTYIPFAMPPYYSEYRYCFSSTMLIWLGLMTAWIALLWLIVILLAIMTRHIKKKNFKDTKKVNIFVFVVFVDFIASIALINFLEAIEYVVIAHAIRWCMEFSIVLLCHLLLFLPKFAPILHGCHSKFRKARYTVQTSKYLHSTATTML